MEKEILKLLLEQQANGTLADDQKIQLEAFMKDSANQEVITQAFAELIDAQPLHTDYTIQRFSHILPLVLSADVVAISPAVSKPVFESAIPINKRFSKRSWLSYAAVILLFLGAGIYFRNPKNTAKEVVSHAETPDILPGGSKAVLTLADGTRIILDTAANGSLSDKGGIKIIKLADGQLKYNAANGSAEGAYNTISTPRGGRYQILLADGTSVWLNAASSLRFPVSFSEKERTVEITGEAYFEIAEEANRPFKVSGGGTTVQVLGTSFNMNSYTDEPAVNTTLLQGSVRVIYGSSNRLLTPGQQASAVASGDIKLLKNVDVEEVTAWKNGTFRFNHADLPAVMRQIARWYDVTIEFENGVPDIPFSGEMQQDLTLNQVLQVLVKMGVNTKISGRRLIVSR